MKSRILIFCFFLLAASISFGQIPFRLIDEDPEVNADLLLGHKNGTLTAVEIQKLIGFQKGQLIIKQWNGSFWTQLPKLWSGQFKIGSENVISMEEHNAQLFLAGSFINANGNIDGLARWNGSAWEEVAGGLSSTYRIHKEISVNDMQSYGQDLFICGLFNRAGSSTVSNLVSLRNNTWTSYATNDGRFSSMAVVNDTLFLAGEFQQIEGVSSQNLIAFYQGNWISFSAPGSSPVQHLGNYGNRLVAVSNGICHLYENGQWKQLSASWSYEIENIGSMVEHSGALYLSGRFKGSSAIIHLLKWNGLKWEEQIREEHLAPINQTSYRLAAHKERLYFGGNIAEFSGETAWSLIELQPGKSVVKGKLYFDFNKNCQFDQGDVPVVNSILSINGGQYYTSTDENGFYSVFISNNSTTGLEVFPGENQIIECAHPLRIIETFNWDSTINHDFAFVVIPAKNPMTTQLYSARGFKARHGYTNDYTITVDGIQAENYPIKVELQYDERLTDFQFDIEPESIGNGIIRWELSMGEDIHFSCKVDHQSFQAGEELHFLLFSFADRFPQQIYAEAVLVQTIVAAFDPNDKQCDYTEIFEDHELLNYHVRFQNLGTDTAVDIHIIDTIDPRIALQYLKILATSHQDKYTASFRVRDHAVIWSFKNIQLAPQFLSNDEMSSGFVQFQTKLSPDLKLGDSISNRASIYFDFQPAVQTNEVLSVVVEPKIPVTGSSSQVILYPNPASSSLTIRTQKFQFNKIDIIRSDGKVMGSISFDQAESSCVIPLNDFGAGAYYVRIYNSEGILVKPLIITH